ncbi:unnamed protein product, partial [Choristocarpus tenellus]
KAKEVTITLTNNAYKIDDGGGFPLVFGWNGIMYAANPERQPPPEVTPFAATVSTAMVSG